ncbi:MAG: amidohydrolase [Planctomycetes bacterium]|nr:amidohydrolase [Planctomycetota bacterium]
MQTQTAWATQLDRIIDELQSKMIEVRRHLHMHPEPSGEESQTTRFLRDQFAGEDVSIRQGPGECGLIIDPDPPMPQPRIALRADIDALRIEEANPVKYRSLNAGIMHACGHDGHTAVVLGALLGLIAMHNRGALPWAVNWRGIFQPAEETCRGALAMVEAGAVTEVEAILAVHMDPSRAVGTIGVRAGVFTADCDELTIEIHGKGGHAARPHEALDPIAAAAQLINAIYASVPRAVDAHVPLVVTFGKIHGGASFNVIPDRVTLGGTVRSAGADARQRAIDQIQQAARGVAMTTGTRIEVTLVHGPPAVFNDPSLTGYVRLAAAAVIGEEQVQSIARPSMGGEDFANYLAHVPGSMFRLGCAPTAEGSPALHSPLFDLDERALAIGAKILARAVVQWAKGPPS